MQCRDDMEQLLSRYADGEIGTDDRARVDEHLPECAACRDLLDLFRKNESLLSNALTTEAFGNAVVESVSRSIRESARPAPAGASTGRRVALGAAAALLVAGLVAALSASQASRDREIRVMIADLAGKVDQTQSEAHARKRADGDTHERLIRDIKARDAIRDAGNGMALGYLEPDHCIVVKASFDSTYTAFDVHRREEKQAEGEYTILNKGGTLSAPEFTDRSARRGQGYFYKFSASRGEKDSIESAPVFMFIPLAGDLSREESVRIHCDKVAVTGSMAVFELERVVSGAPLTVSVNVQVGKPVGGLQQIPGVGDVDFGTNLVLDRIVEGNQGLATQYTEPVLDELGKPLMRKLESGRLIPATTQREVVLSLRSNLRAVLRRAGTPPGSDGLHLWQGSWMRVRARG